MTHIQCNHCRGDIPDAAGRLRCGVSKPVTLTSRQEPCPWCVTAIDAQASISPGCRAQPGPYESTEHLHRELMCPTFAC